MKKYKIQLFFVLPLLSLLWACGEGTYNREDLKRAITMETILPDSSMHIYNEIIEGTKDDSLRASAYYQKGLYYKKNAENDSALYNFKQALAIPNLRSLQAYLAHRYTAWIHLSSLNDDLAMESHLSQLKLSKNFADSFRLGESWLDIGKLFFGTQDHEKALAYFQRALDLSYKEKDSSLTKLALARFGTYYGEKKDYPKAISYFEKAIEYAKINDDNDFICSTNGNIAMCFMYSDKYEEALQIHKEVISFFKKEKGQQLNLIRSYRNLAIAFYRMQKVDSSFYYLEKAQKLSHETKTYNVLGNIIASKRELAEVSGRYKEALQYEKEFRIFKDSLALEQKSVALENLRSKYEEDKRVIRVKEDEKRKRLTYIYVSALMILVLVSITIYIRRNLLIHKKNLELQKLKQEAVSLELKEKRKDIFDFSKRLQEKNRILLDLEQELQLLKNESMSNCDMLRIKQTLKLHLIEENALGIIEEKIEKANSDFFIQLKKEHPHINSDEINLIGMLRMKFSTKQIADVLNLSERAIEQKRYRLRKKMELNKGENLQEYIQNI